MIFMSFIQPLLLWFLIGSFLVALLGSNKRMGFWGYLFASLLLSPVIGLLLVIVSSPVEEV